MFGWRLLLGSASSGAGAGVAVGWRLRWRLLVTNPLHFSDRTVLAAAYIGGATIAITRRSILPSDDYEEEAGGDDRV
jgi:hypothetical protein